MTDAHWLQVKELFQQAAELSTAERLSFLAQACGSDAALRAEVEKLLAADANAASFLESTPLTSLNTDNLATGQQLGSYRLLGELGRGGMGTVYLAERADEQFLQQVAIKIIRRGMDTEDILRRFRNERQILASLNHPNIARLLDGGTTADGRPFYVMEYIEGSFIDEDCQARQLALNERLQLFRQVCAAVHYAHQRLVIHRDLKPTNILVTPRGEVKLLDFGIAKLLTPDTRDPAATATLLGLMTPAYASPEQVRGESITTASDVYALGIILYELLTGQRPYTFANARPDHIAQVICETETERPSAVAERMKDEGGRMKVSSALLHPSSLIPHPSALRGDLDNIVLMALRKDPQRRYASVEQLAEDLRRHLEGLPVSARPDTLRYRTVKFIQRNRALTAATLIVLLTLLGGIIATARQARIAERERALAQQRFADVRQLANSFVFKYHDAIANLPGSTAVRAQLVKDATAYLDKLSQQATGDAVLQLELAQAYTKLGIVQGRRYDANVGDTEGALASLRKSRELLETLRRNESHNLPVRVALFELYQELGDLLSHTGQRPEALDLQERALAVTQELVAAEPKNPTYRLHLIKAYLKLGDVMPMKRAGTEDRLDVYLRALPLAEELYRTDERRPEYLSTLARLHQRIGSYLSWQARGRVKRDDGLDGSPQLYQQVRSHQQRAVELTEQLFAINSSDYQAKRNLMAAYVNYGEVLRLNGEHDQALQWQSRALLLMEEMHRHDPANHEARSDLGEVEHEIALTYASKGDAQRANAHNRRAQAHKEAVFAQDAKNLEAQRAVKSFAQALEQELARQRQHSKK
jgi:eukaryotic-like serine/threonine-protein kinase